MSASVGGTGRLRGFRGVLPPRACVGVLERPLSKRRPHTRGRAVVCPVRESRDGRRKVGVIARVSGADAIYGAGRARPLRGRAEVSLGSRLPPCPEGAGSGGERWAHKAYG